MPSPANYVISSNGLIADRRISIVEECGVLVCADVMVEVPVVFRDCTPAAFGRHLVADRSEMRAGATVLHKAGKYERTDFREAEPPPRRP